MSLSTWLGFLATVSLMALSPGPGAVASMNMGLSRGYAAALRLILGLQAALLLQLAVVAAGLGAVLLASPTAYQGLRLVGAAYLVWLGVAQWRQATQDGTVMAASLAMPFRQGLLVNLSNPKAVIFVGALVPQFLRPEQALVPQYALLAVTMCVIDIAVMSGYALSAARLSAWLARPAARRGLQRLFGAVLVALGGVLILT